MSAYESLPDGGAFTATVARIAEIEYSMLMRRIRARLEVGWKSRA